MPSGCTELSLADKILRHKIVFSEIRPGFADF